MSQRGEETPNVDLAWKKEKPWRANCFSTNQSLLHSFPKGNINWTANKDPNYIISLVLKVTSHLLIWLSLLCCAARVPLGIFCPSPSLGDSLSFTAKLFTFRPLLSLYPSVLWPARRAEPCPRRRGKEDEIKDSSGMREGEAEGDLHQRELIRSSHSKEITPALDISSHFFPEQISLRLEEKKCSTLGRCCDALPV